MAKNKLKALAAARSTIEKNHGKGALMSLDESAVVPVAVWPSGCATLDAALGAGGYPKGRVVEVFGPESSGKTTLTLHAIAECQRAGGTCAFVDAEHALDVAYAKALGVDVGSLLISQPDCGEQALDIAETLVQSEALDLLVIDSVAALVPKNEIEGVMGDNHVGLHARLMSQAMRKLPSIAFRTGTTLFFINQLRMKIGVAFGNPEVTTGGNALKYFATMRLDVRRIGPVKSGDQVVGNRTRVKVVKNKVAPPFRIAEFDIRYGSGIDAVGDLLDRSVERGVLDKSGAHYSFQGERIAQGREAARRSLEENHEMREKIVRELARPTKTVSEDAA